MRYYNVDYSFWYHVSLRQKHISAASTFIFQNSDPYVPLEQQTPDQFLGTDIML